MKYTVEYPVKPNGISQSLIFIEETLEKYRLGQRDLMEALLISEETLMMLEENASEEEKIEYKNSIGRAALYWVITIKGKN